MSDFNENSNNGQYNQTETPYNGAEPVLNGQPDFSGSQIIAGAEVVKKKSIAGKIAAIAAAVVVVLGAGSAAAYNFVPTVKNTVKLYTNKPEKYYAWVEEENMQKTADDISSAYGKLIGSSNSAKEQEVEIKADVDSDAVRDLLEELSGSPLTSSGITIPSNMSIKLAAKNDDSISGALQLNADNETLGTMNVYMQDDGTAYAQIPEISPAYLSMDFQAIMGEAMDDLSSELGNNMYTSEIMDAVMTMYTDPDAISDALSDMLSEKELNDLISRYSAIVFNNLDEVEVEKGVKCEVDDLEAKYNMLAADVDYGALFSIAKDALKEAKGDKTIIKLVENFGVDESTYKDAINGVLDQMGTLDVSGGDVLFTMNVYVDSKGVIRGREIEIPDKDTDVDAEINYMTIKKGSETAFEANLLFDGEGLTLTSNSKEKSGKSSGNIDINIIGDEDVKIPIEFEDYEVINADKGYANGKFTLDLSDIADFAISITAESDGKGQSYSTDITANGTNYGTITVSTSEKLSLDIPEFDSSQSVYSITNDGDEVMQYLSDASGNFADFLDGVGEAFGVQGIGQLFGAALTSSSADDNVFDNNSTGITTTTNDTVYPFKSLKIMISDQNVPMPAIVNGILSLVKVEDTQIAAGDYRAYYNDGYTFSISITNNTDSALKPDECAVTGFSVSEGSPITASVDGFTIGSKISDVAAFYGASLTEPESGYITIYDSASDWNDMTFYYYDGKVYSIYLSFYEF